ncbi:MAG TPA: hypothetical protein VN914_08600, partial [Polyangia bacterium]|nr:hypothetical protein [Polyangia bacterium]
DVCDALAASGWRILEARVGRERMLSLARAALTRAGTGDVRDYLWERRHPTRRLFEGATGLDYETFLETWQRELFRLRGHPAAAALLASLPGGAISVRSDPARGVGFQAKLAAPLATDTTCTLRHVRLPPHDLPISPDTLEEVKFVWPRGQTNLERYLPNQYGRGERVFLALDCDLPSIGSWARLVQERVTAP